MFPGVLLIAGLSLAAYVLAVGGGLARYGASSLTLAIVLGAVLGNLRPHWVTGRCHGGVQLAQKEFLRTGVALYGFNLSLQQILQVGSSGIVVDLLLVSSTLAMGGEGQGKGGGLAGARRGSSGADLPGKGEFIHPGRVV